VVYTGTSQQCHPPSRSFLLIASHLKRRRRRRSPPNHQIYHQQKENKQRREKAEELDRSKKTKLKSTVLCVFSSFTGDGVPHSRQGGEEKKKAG
jgi:hypothetical protein